MKLKIGKCYLPKITTREENPVEYFVTIIGIIDNEMVKRIFSWIGDDKVLYTGYINEFGQNKFTIGLYDKDGIYALGFKPEQDLIEEYDNG